MNTQQGAQEILAHAEAIYVPKHEHVPVRESDFGHLDLKFYRNTRTALETQGFVHLEDYEDRTLAGAPGNVLMPVMIRAMRSIDGSMAAGIYQARVRPIWLRILVRLLGKHPGKNVDFETEFPDGSFVCTTNAVGASAIDLPPSVQSEFLPRNTSVTKLLERHRQRVIEKQTTSGLSPRRISTMAELYASQDRMNAIKAAHRAEKGISREELEKASPLGGRALAEEVHGEMTRIIEARKEPTRSASDGTVQAPASTLADERLLAAVVARGEDSGSKDSGNKLLWLTAFLFVLFGALSWGWATVVYLAAAIAFHELGHVLAMRYFGYKNVRMLFVPFFGGLATGEPRELDATKNALVAIAGPVFGLFTVVLTGVAAMYLGAPAWLVEFAWVSLALNAFNLLPIVPLDGGQFTNDVLFSRFPVLELIFRLLAVAALGWLAYAWQTWLLGALALFLLISTPFAFRRARLIRDARRDEAWQSRPLDLAAVVALRELVTQVFAKLPPEKYQSKTPEHVHGLWLAIRKRFPGPGQTVALIGGYLFLGLILYPLVAVLLVRLFGKTL